MRVPIASKRAFISARRPSIFPSSRPSTPEMLAASAKKLFDRIASGVLQPKIGQTYELEDAAKAHRALENRETTGSTVLIP